MDMNSEVAGNSIVLLLTSREKYHAEIVEAAKAAAANFSKTCYICINQPYNFITANLGKNNIEAAKFFFVDTLTKGVQPPPNVDNCIFVSAPNALTEISLAFSKAISEKKCDGMIFDTLSALMVYENPHSLIQFVHNILTKLRIASGKAIFVALKDDLNSELVKDLYMFVDKVLEP